MFWDKSLKQNFNNFLPKINNIPHGGHIYETFKSSKNLQIFAGLFTSYTVSQLLILETGIVEKHKNKSSFKLRSSICMSYILLCIMCMNEVVLTCIVFSFRKSQNVTVEMLLDVDPLQPFH